MGYAVGFQVPFLPERSLTADEGARISALLAEWSADDTWIDDETAAAYRAAFLRWPTAHTAIEYHRWAVRSVLRPDGLSYMSLMEAPIQCPVLQVQGSEDSMVLSSSVDGSEEYVRASYARVDLPCGHFPQEELPQKLIDVLLPWLAETDRT